MASFTKPEVHITYRSSNLPSEKTPVTSMDNMHRTFGDVWTCSFREKQEDTQTHWSQPYRVRTNSAESRAVSLHRQPSYFFVCTVISCWLLREHTHTQRERERESGRLDCGLHATAKTLLDRSDRPKDRRTEGRRRRPLKQMRPV